MFRSLAAAGVAAVLVSSGPASALESATTTDLNLRSGPGPNYAVTGVIPGGTAVDVAGCIEAANWCQVSYNGQTGWSYGDYLTTAVGSEPVYLTVDRARTQVRTIVYDDTGEQSAAIVGSMGAVAGALIAGPGGRRRRRQRCRRGRNGRPRRNRDDLCHGESRRLRVPRRRGRGGGRSA
jgi:uncharacterized protein YraI